MKVLRRFPLHWGMWFYVLGFFTGCGSAHPVHFYQLSALPYVELDDRPVTVGKEKVVGVGPIDIPSYVDRAHLVIRAGQTELEVREFDRWAEPLERNLRRVLLDNLSQLLAVRGATAVGWDEGLSIDYRVRIEFTQLDFMKTGEVSLTARWFILEKDSQDARVIKTSRFTGSGISGDYGSLVFEMSQHVESLSREMASAFINIIEER